MRDTQKRRFDSLGEELKNRMEEAMNARLHAEEKMESKDFVTARQIALKAMRQHPYLENLSRLLLICDVHCASMTRSVYGDMDWYGILQVERTADEATIEAKFTKFVFLLHPYANTFSGAEGAFKLVCEAQRVLLDKDKRRLYDMKSGPTPIPGTFQTTCPFCTVRYQHYKEVMNQSIHCQNCSNPFIAYDTGKTEARSHKHVDGTSRTEYAQKEDEHVDGIKRVGEAEKIVLDKEERILHDVKNGTFWTTCPFCKWRYKYYTEVKNRSVRCQNCSHHFVAYDTRKTEARSQKTSHETSKKRTRDQINRSSSSGSIKEEIGDTKSKDDEGIEQNVDNEEQRVPNGHEATKKSFKINDDSDSSSEIEVSDPLVSYPDPEFSNFDEDRSFERFSEGQIWACYDDKGALPRFYASIKKVFSPSFKMQISWLEPDPDDKNEKAWLSKNLPISCGKFRLHKTEETDNLPMFSHAMTCPRGIGGDNTIVIYPRKAEIWAIFKNWDINWSRKRRFEYDFVVILTDYSHVAGTYVGLLTKVQGYVSLFRRTESAGMLIPPKEVFKFSHMAPSCNIKDNERVPIDCFELDPAALPLELFSSEQKGKDGNSKNIPVEVNSSESSEFPESESLEVPEPEFFNFLAQKQNEQFQIGQIWALYSDEDEMPKYYGEIKKLKTSPSFSVRVSWLSSSRPENCISWNDKDMLVGCGTFHSAKSSSSDYDLVNPFSHQVKVIEISGRRKEFKILPSRGEVWALYKNWKLDLKLPDLKNCDYDIVEILGDNDSKIEVSVLERVREYNSVFKVQTEGRSSVTKTISHRELVKFSHQIPGFCLTNEKNGALRGFWELDPAALPANILRKN